MVQVTQQKGTPTPPPTKTTSSTSTPTSPPNNGPPKPEGGILGRISPVSLRRKGVVLCTYGRGKTGKTRLASSFPKPCLIIGTEDGTKSVTNVPGVDFVDLRHSGEMDDLVKLLKGGNSFWKKTNDPKKPWAQLETRTGDRYQSSSVDTAGGIQDIILKEVLGLDEIPVQKTWGLTDKATWGTVGIQFKECMSKFIDLARTHSLHLCIIAHERNFKEEENTNDIMVPHVGPALTPSASGWLNGVCDYIVQMFIREQLKTVNQDGVILHEKTGKKEYCMRMGSHSIYATGFRLPDGVPLPDIMVNPSFQKMYALITAQPTLT